MLFLEFQQRWSSEQKNHLELNCIPVMEGCRGKQYSQHLQAIDELNNQHIGW
jgi:hypothetical protein